MSTGPNNHLPATTMPEPYANAWEHEASGGYEDDDEGAGIDLRRYVAALLRYKWVILALSALGLAAGTGLSKLVKSVYEAQATIQIDVVSRNAAQASPVRASQLLESRAWIDLMRSFRVLDEVVRRRRLFIEAAQEKDASLFAEFALAEEFTPGDYRVVAAPDMRVRLLDATGAIVDEVTQGDSIGVSLGFAWRAPALRQGQDVAFAIVTPRDAAVELGENLSTSLPIDNPSFLRMTMRGVDPEATAATVNEVAERFVEVATALKREKLTTYTRILGEQLATAYADLRTAESALESFRVGTITLPSDRGATQIASGLAETRDPVRDAFFQLRIDRDALVLDRDAILRALETGRDSTSALIISLGSITSVRETPELAATLADLSAKRAEANGLSVAFTSAHRPLQELRRQIDQLERVTVPAQANRLVENLDVRIREFDQRIAASAREMQQIPTRAIEETRKESDVAIARTLHTQLRESYEEARLAELSAAPDVRILDRAETPTKPVTDRIIMIIGGGLFAGLAFGVALAILLDRMDRRLRYPDQVTRDLGLTILGALPLVRSARDGRSLKEDQEYLVEALRSIRLNLAYSHGTAGPFITTISSPGPGDGKSFLASHLAASFVAGGRRTLIIDGDTRRGRLHRIFARDRRPGLLDYLAGTCTKEQIVQHIPSTGVDFISCGTRTADGPELLASTKMSQLLMALRTEYDALIVDSPPLGAGVDPLVLASLTGSLVMVLRAGVTDRELAEARLHDLNRLPIRVLGAVLNEVKAEGAYRYYSYLPGYRAEDEVEAEGSAASRQSLIGSR